MQKSIVVRPVLRSRSVTFPYYIRGTVAVRTVGLLSDEPVAAGAGSSTSSFNRDHTTPVFAQVTGYSTETLRDSGAAGVRFQASSDLREGAYLVAVRSTGSSASAGWLVGLAGVPIHRKDSAEVTVFGVPHDEFRTLGCLDEATLRQVYEIGSRVELRFVHFLQRFEPVVCTGGPWLRDRLCTLASQVNEMFGRPESDAAESVLDLTVSLNHMLNRAGLQVSTVGPGRL